MSNTQGLIDGGRPGLFWGYLWTFIGYGFIAASMAEMGSMAPTAGGQYHWTSEFAPPQYQRQLSYLSGWLLTLCWQAGNASGIFIEGIIIQALISIRDPSYGWAAWQGWILVVAVSVVCCAFNTFGESFLPKLQYLAMILHVGGFIATVAVLWAYGTPSSAEEVFLEFTNFGGWSSTGLAVMVGQLTVVFALGGSDSAAHMAEEVKDSGLSVPRAIFWTIIINAMLGLIATITFIFVIPSLHDAINDPTGFSMIYVFGYWTGTNGAIALVLIQLVLVQVSNISYQAACSRLTFAVSLSVPRAFRIMANET